MELAKLTRAVLGMGAILSAPALAADPAAIDWKSVPTKTLTLFYPAQSTFQWLRSSGHRRNILEPRFTHLGVGVAVGRYEDRYQVLWVQEFARR